MMLLTYLQQLNLFPQVPSAQQLVPYKGPLVNLTGIFFKYNGTSLVAANILQRIPFNENFIFYSKTNRLFLIELELRLKQNCSQI